MSGPLVLDRTRARATLVEVLSTVLARQWAEKLASRALDALEQTVTPPVAALPTDLERANARNMARRVGLHVKGER
ncbi:MAG: hypothetical protein H6722_34940 [Sandaracinus sp.]|nr:hypothetical protein [Sandaracinus sp.]